MTLERNSLTPLKMDTQERQPNLVTNESQERCLTHQRDARTLLNSKLREDSHSHERSLHDEPNEQHHFFQLKDKEKGSKQNLILELDEDIQTVPGARQKHERMKSTLQEPSSQAGFNGEAASGNDNNIHGERQIITERNHKAGAQFKRSSTYESQIGAEDRGSKIGTGTEAGKPSVKATQDDFSDLGKSNKELLQFRDEK